MDVTTATRPSWATRDLRLMGACGTPTRTFYRTVVPVNCQLTRSLHRAVDRNPGIEVPARVRPTGVSSWRSVPEHSTRSIRSVVLSSAMSPFVSTWGLVYDPARHGYSIAVRAVFGTPPPRYNTTLITANLGLRGLVHVHARRDATINREAGFWRSVADPTAGASVWRSGAEQGSPPTTAR